MEVLMVDRNIDSRVAVESLFEIGFNQNAPLMLLLVSLFVALSATQLAVTRCHLKSVLLERGVE
jgi:hypothetical protein